MPFPIGLSNFPSGWSTDPPPTCKTAETGRTVALGGTAETGCPGSAFQHRAEQTQEAERVGRLKCQAAQWRIEKLDCTEFQWSTGNGKQGGEGVGI